MVAHYNNNPLGILNFFTAWALLFHILSRIGLLPINTFFMAIVVLVGSIVILWFYPGYYKQIWNHNETNVNSHTYERTKYKGRYIMIFTFKDFFTHYLPLFIGKYPTSTYDWINGAVFTAVTIVIYIALFGWKWIWDYYYNLLDDEKSVFTNGQ